MKNLKKLANDRRGIIPFFPLIILAAIVIVLLVVFVFTLPKLIGIFAIGAGIAIAIMSAKSGSLNSTTVSLVLIFTIGGFLLMFVPTVQGLLGNLQTLTMIDLMR